MGSCMLRANIVTDVKPRFDLTEGGMKKREESELLATRSRKTGEDQFNR